ncbi:MAG: hypothetical protein C1O27_002200 [Chloroflexi bacterium]|nr:MAG: hypothetical protein C1O27_002200 [Chloroflexota bacterium]
MKAAYFHSVGGASGDMTLAALLDAGLPLPKLEEAIAALGLSGIGLKTWRDRRGAIAGTRVDVDVPDGPARSIADFVKIIQNSSLPETVQKQAVSIFERLGEAEAAVHGTHDGPPKLHELGSLDTLVDVVGAVAGLHTMGVEAVYASPLMLGSGTVKTSHGILPVPGPATAHLIASAAAPVSPPPREPLGELTTPTGAAILTTLATFSTPTIRVEAIGYGLGAKKVDGLPNALAVWLGEVTSEGSSLVLLETNIDDSTPEVLAYVQERLMELGALDAWLTPVHMKKGRSGAQLSVLAEANLEPLLVEAILRETSTLGVRRRSVDRYEAQREMRQVETDLGVIGVKVKLLNKRVISVAPEFEDCRRLAQELGLPLQEVYRIAEEAAWSAASSI